MKGKLIGLDIGNNAIKVASLRRDGDIFAIDAIGQAPTPSKGMISDSPTDLEAVAQSIKDLFTASNIKGREIALCLGESEVYTKIIEMPQLSPQELSAALRFEMEQYIPLPIDKVKTDWQILAQNEDQGKKTMSVMIVAAPISLLEKYQNVMDLAHISAESIETEIVAVHRGLLPHISSQYSNMILHMGAASTTIAIVRQGVIKTVFSTATGGTSFTRSISIELGIDLLQAENYKKAYGFNQNAFEGKIGKVLLPAVDVIVQDIKKSALSFREKYNNDTIKQIFLSGGSALIPGIEAVLTNALSTQVVRGSAFTAYNVTNVPQELEVESPAYNAVVGLALRGLV